MVAGRRGDALAAIQHSFSHVSRCRLGQSEETKAPRRIPRSCEKRPYTTSSLASVLGWTNREAPTYPDSQSSQTCSRATIAFSVSLASTPIWTNPDTFEGIPCDATISRRCDVAFVILVNSKTPSHPAYATDNSSFDIHPFGANLETRLYAEGRHGSGHNDHRIRSFFSCSCYPSCSLDYWPIETQQTRYRLAASRVLPYGPLFCLRLRLASS